MEQLNRIELRGNVGNIRVRETSSGQFARFSVATNYVFKDKEGAAVIETTWHNVVAWNGRGMPEDLNTIQKGMPVYVIGRLRMQKYTGTDGVEHSVYEVVAKTLEIVKEKEQLTPGY